MDWLTQIAEELTPRLDIDDPDSEDCHAGFSFEQWDGPLRAEPTKSKDGIQLVRPFTMTVPGPEQIGEDEIECSLVIDTIEGRAWICVGRYRQSPFRKIKMTSIKEEQLQWQVDFMKELLDKALPNWRKVMKEASADIEAALEHIDHKGE